MFAIQTNLYFDINKELHQKNEEPARILALCNRKEDALAIADLIDHLWIRTSQKQHEASNYWKPLNDTQVVIRPRVYKIESNEVEISQSFGMATNLYFDIEGELWYDYHTNPSNIIAIFDRKEDADAVAAHIEYLWLKTIEKRVNEPNQSITTEAKSIYGKAIPIVIKEFEIPK